MARVVERSRISARSPGSTRSRASVAPSELLDADAHVAHGLLLGPAARAGDPRDPDPELGIEAREGPVGHRLGNLRRYRALGLDQLGRDAQQVHLGLVRVSDHATRDVLRRAGDLGQARGEQARRARLGEPDPPAREQLRDLLVDR